MDGIRVALGALGTDSRDRFIGKAIGFVGVKIGGSIHGDLLVKEAIPVAFPLMDPS